MKKIILFAFLILNFTQVSLAQTAISATGVAPNSSAILDMIATNKGALLPRVALTGPNDNTTITNPAKYLVVVDTVSAGGLVPGIYYNNGTIAAPVWTQLATGTGATGYIQNQHTAAQTSSTYWISGVGTFGDGTAALPSVTFNTSPTTAGLFSAGANTIGFSTTALERMRVDASGNVGIASTSPLAKLHVGGNGTALSGNGIIVGTVGASLNTAVAVGAETGRFEIAFPGWRDVEANQIGAKIAAIRRNNYNPSSALIQSTDLAFFTGTGTDGASTSTFLDLTSEKMRIDFNGNVGIGTTAPLSQLHTTGTVRFGNYLSGMIGTDASGVLQTRTITGTSNQLDVTNGNGVAGNPTLNINSSYTADLKANANMTGGGTVSYISSVLKWTARFIVISNGNGAHFSTSGYFDLDMPTSGTITGVGGAANATATAAGIPLSGWQALYYILPIGSGNASVAANYRIAYFTSALTIPETWVLVAVVNGDDNSVRLGTGITINSGGTFIPSSGYINNQTVNATFATGQSASFDITGNGEVNGTLNVNGNVGIGVMNPSYKLQVQKTAVATPALMIGGGFAGGPRLQTYGLDADANAYMGLGADMGGGPYEHSIFYSGVASSKLTFGIYDGTTYTTRATMINNGNFGIGTTVPASKLHISGGVPAGIGALPANTMFTVDNSASDNYITLRSRADLGNYAGIQFQDNNVGGYIAFRTYVGSGANDGTNGDYMVYGTYTDHIFQAGSSETVNGKTEMMRIKGTGNVGIGTSAPSTRLHVYGSALRVGSASTDPGATDGVISLGNTGVNYNPTTTNWTTTGTTMVLNASDYSTIGFHDSGNRVDFIRTGVGVIQLGYDGGWGAATIQVPSLAGGSTRYVTASTTGVLAATTPVVGGSGTTNYITKWTPNGSTLGNSVMYDDGTNVGIGTTAPADKLDVRDALGVNRINFRNIGGGDDSDPYAMRKVQSSSNTNYLELQLNDDATEEFRIYGNSCVGYGCGAISGNLYHFFRADGTTFHAGNIGIGTQAPANLFSVGASSQFQINSAGVVTTIQGYTPPNNAMRMTTNFHLNSGTGNAVMVNWDNGTTGATQTFRVGNGAGGDVFYVYADGQTFTNNWFRPLSNTGLFFQAWGGGWHMTDGTWIRAYNTKPVLSDAGFAGNGNSIGTVQGIAANMYANYNNATGAGIVVSDDGGIGDWNDAWLQLRSSYGLQIRSGNTNNALYILTQNAVGGGAVQDKYVVPSNNAYGYLGISGQGWWYTYTYNLASPSKREQKREITPVTGSISDYVMNDLEKLKPSFYKFKVEEDTWGDGKETKFREQPHLGLILDETPDYIQSADFGAVDLYGLATLAALGAKENQKEIKQIKAAVGIDKTSRTINDFGSVQATNTELWVEYNVDFASQLNGVLPVITLTANTRGLTLSIIEKNATGFRVAVEGTIENTVIDYIAMAKVKNPVSEENEVDQSATISKLTVAPEVKATVTKWWDERPLREAEAQKQIAIEAKLLQEQRKKETALPADFQRPENSGVHDPKANDANALIRESEKAAKQAELDVRKPQQHINDK
jgi:hypothetical protein